MIKIAFLLTEDWFFCSHFMERAVAAKNLGYDVIVVAREGTHAPAIRARGLRFIPISFDRRSMNIFSECRMVLNIMKIYRREKPDIVHHVALKPIIYGSLAACLVTKSGIVNAPVGMGYLFSSNDMLAKVVKPFVKILMRVFLNPKRSIVVFENSEDLKNAVSCGSANVQHSVLIRGAGVDVKKLTPVISKSGIPLVVLVSRMLRDKGIYEFVNAAKNLQLQGIKSRFVLVGDADPGNPASISVNQLSAWNGRNGVEWWGWRNNVSEVLSEASIVCLPSYREGLPKCLIEACSCGLPIVATDAVGCREVVRHEDNGLLVPIKDAEALAEAIKRLLQNPAERQRMGTRGRERAEKEFNQEIIIQQTLDVYREVLLNGSCPVTESGIWLKH